MSDSGELDLNSLNDEELTQQVHDDLYDGLKEEAILLLGEITDNHFLIWRQRPRRFEHFLPAAL